ncbi:Crp/Fnr family transcriptional regulator [Rubellimicrobium roseum]|uniref:Crp/Fnr family transcriptional regulator n=2 Tax=Rubellimicrobium roseum TaxID=687525 RepID=A0A5C4N9L3_9RHOB|nr:Crp/Fnr family transcriptional regulator [Rubellimicrobium roseum]
MFPMNLRSSPKPTGNALLARLGLGAADVDVVPAVRGHVLWEPDVQLETAVFPLSGMVSLVVSTEDGRSAEVATVGREGAAGVTPGLRPVPSFARAVVQIPGDMAHLDLARLRELAQSNDALGEVLDHWREVLLRQVMQGAACNALHETPERAARWIAMTRDRTDGDDLPLTQEFLAEMLGVNRPTVTLAAQDLAARGLIEYRRGTIRILDRDGLEGAACDCLRAGRAAYRQLLGA